MATKGENMEDKNWVVDLEKQLEKWIPFNEMDLWSRRSIYKVPKFFTDENNDAFRPQIVSFGPYHHDEEQVKGMENLKRRSVLHFLKGSGKPIQNYLSELEIQKDELMEYYEHLDPKWKDSDKFLKLMFMDGCFMLQILMDYSHLKSSFSNRYVDNAIFGVGGRGKEYILLQIARDMLLIENQLPLLVLETIASIGFQDIESMMPIPELIQKFLRSPVRGMAGSFLHVLDVYYQLNILKRGKQGTVMDYYCSQEIMQPATKLDKADIQFKLRKAMRLNDLHLDTDNGELNFPKIKVDSDTKVKLLNLMAFELLHFGKGLEVATYVSLLMSMAHTVEDVSLLQSKDIIENSLGSDEEVAKIFKDLSKAARSIALKYISAGEKCPVQEVNKCYKKRMSTRKRRIREWGDNLFDTHFKDPWTISSFIAAVILLIVSIAQLVFAILQYKHDNKKQK